MMILAHRPDADYSGIHSRSDGTEFEVYRRAGRWFWREVRCDREGFVIEYLGDESIPFPSSYEAFCDA